MFFPIFDYSKMPFAIISLLSIIVCPFAITVSISKLSLSMITISPSHSSSIYPLFDTSAGFAVIGLRAMSIDIFSSKITS